jgi:alkylation response protein AidB-like acyl-CoA dehydrogenase
MPVDRLVPTREGAELVQLVREIAQAELAPRAAADEAASRFPREAFTLLGRAGVLGMPYPESYGGAGQPYEVYLQALEEIATAWLSVGVGARCIDGAVPAHDVGTPTQQESLLPSLIAGTGLVPTPSESHAGSDISGMTTWLPPPTATPSAARLGSRTARWPTSLTSLDQR